MHAASPSLVEAVFNRGVRHGRFLGRIPLLPAFVDALFRLAVALGDPARHRAMSAIEKAVGAAPGTSTGSHRFGGVSFRRGGREFAHLHGCGLLDVWLGRETALACIAEGLAEPHHVFGESGWASRWVRGDADVAGALELARRARERAATARADR
jgi:hypothetical protein